MDCSVGVSGWLHYCWSVVTLESVARAGIGRGKPCGLIIPAFAVIFVSDIVLIIVVDYCLCLCMQGATGTI